MPEDAFYMRLSVPSEDPYAAFADIFGRPPPPGRIPTSIGLGTHPTAPASAKAVPNFQVYSPFNYDGQSHQAMPPQPRSASVASTTSTISSYGTPGYANLCPEISSAALNFSSSLRNVSRRSISDMNMPVPYAGASQSVTGLTASIEHQGIPELNSEEDERTKHILVGSRSSQDLPNTRISDDHSMTRSVSHVWSGLKKQVSMQRSAPSTVITSRKQVTKGGRAIPARSDPGAFAQMYGHSNQAGSQGRPPINGLAISDGSAPQSTSHYTSDVLVGKDVDSGRGFPSRKSSSATLGSMGGRSTILASSRREPLVYPALLGLVSQKFRERMTPVLGDRVKNELTYKNAFTGAEAVDVMAYIIKTLDRNLALLLGRSLDAQKLFHDVTYDNRLRDSVSEVYQFTTFDEQSDSVPEPNGVFTLLSECYSPTCSRNRLCYSISCPRRLEQQARLNMKLDPGLLSQQEASISLNEGQETEEKLWRWTVPPEVVEATSPQEQKRQEAIAELVYTERQFVKSLEYLRESWIKPLRRSNVLGPEPRRDKFIRMVFLNVLEIHAVNLKFAESLTKRQQLNHVVHQIADVVLEFVPRFDPFVNYGAQQMYAKFEFEKERALNPAFAKFVQQTERAPESQQLELNGYLTKPTTRLARYPLLLDAILKRTEKENPDTLNIPTAIEQIREFLFRVNAESGKAENKFSLHQLNQALTFRAGEYVDLHLLDPKRQLVFKGSLHKRPPPGEGNVQVYLFDNAVLFAKRKKVSGMSSSVAAAAAAAAAAVEPPTGDDTNSGREVLRVNSKPIPLPLLQLAESDEIGRRKAAAHMIRTTVTRSADGKATFPITFQHLGRRGYEVVLYAENFQARKTWVETILKQQLAQKHSANIFTQHTLFTASSASSGRAQCSASFDGGKRVLFGTERGVYATEITYQNPEERLSPMSSRMKLILRMVSPVTQIDVVETYGLVIILCDRTLSTFSIDLIDSNADEATRLRGLKQVVNQVSFYKVDEYSGRTLLTVVKSTNLTSTIRVLEPVGPTQPVTKRPPLRRLLTASGSNLSQPDGFKLVKPPIDVPSATLSISFLRSHLCLGCSRGFELLELETGKFESLLDPADTSLDFVIKRESLKPISLYRIGKEFLLNYSDFSFFINRNGWRSKPDWIIQWECTPQRIVLSYPYLIAFDQNLIEIRNMDTVLVRVIHGESIRFLHEFARDILYAVENEKGQDEVVSLNFYEKTPTKQQ